MRIGKVNVLGADTNGQDNGDEIKYGGLTMRQWTYVSIGGAGFLILMALMKKKRKAASRASAPASAPQRAPVREYERGITKITL